MPGTFFGLETAMRGLRAQQSAMDTTAHNIDNLNTPGYTRQQVQLSSTSIVEVPGVFSNTAPAQLGTGVKADDITRLRDTFLDDQFRSQNQYLGQWETQQGTLDKITAILNEPSDTGISAALKDFWNAWGKLGPDPDSLSARMQVKQSAITLTQTLNQTAKQLTNLDSDLQSNLQAKSNEANSYLNQIAALNKQIDQIQQNGDKPDDLLDKRDHLADQLSKIANISINHFGDSYQLSIGNQLVLQDQNVLQTITYDPTANSFSVPITSGDLEGLAVSRQNVQNYHQQLDSLAYGLAEGTMTVQKPDGTTVTVNGLNGLQQLGYGLNKTTNAGNFFDLSAINPTTKNYAETITVDSSIVNDVTNIAAGFTSIPGDGTLAIAMNHAKDSIINYTGSGVSTALPTGTTDDFMQAMIGKLGVQGQEAKRQVSNQQVLVQQLDAKRQSVAGVSIDEEMANMVRYQQAYNASARMVTTIDQMLDTIVNQMGIVGR